VAGVDAPDAAGRLVEAVMLGIRLSEGLDLGIDPRLAAGVGELVADGLLCPKAAARGRARLTLRGRLLADLVTRALLP
jgi:oxygen-independent coproporphyrinogen-3 oxidase